MPLNMDSISRVCSLCRLALLLERLSVLSFSENSYAMTSSSTRSSVLRSCAHRWNPQIAVWAPALLILIHSQPDHNASDQYQCDKWEFWLHLWIKWKEKRKWNSISVNGSLFMPLTYTIKLMDFEFYFLCCSAAPFWICKPVLCERAPDDV